jgi:Trk K+ transport system NAD-binding subunit
VIPHGDTVFQAGDAITAFVQERDVDNLQSCLLGK